MGRGDTRKENTVQNYNQRTFMAQETFVMSTIGSAQCTQHSGARQPMSESGVWPLGSS